MTNASSQHELRRTRLRRRAIVVALSLVLTSAASSAMSCTRTVDLDVPDAMTNTGSDGAIVHDANLSDDAVLSDDGGSTPPDASTGDASTPDA